MAPRSLSTPLTKSAYVCESCLNGTKSFRTARLAATRAFSVASSQRREIPTQSTPLSFTSARRPRFSPRQQGLNLAIRASSRVYATGSEATKTGIAPLPHRRVISLSGPDAAKFLQGLVTNSVDATRLSPFYSAFLDARGRMLWDVFIWVWPELVAEKGHWSCYIEVDENEVEALKKHLKKHKLRSKIDIKDVPTEGQDGMCVWAAWGGARKRVRSWSNIAGFEDPRAEGLYRYLTNADRDSIAEGLQPVDTQYYHLQRYIRGIPEGPHEIPRESALPMEYNTDIFGGIDFKKGCYVGQELTIRTKHTGVVRKRILPVHFYPLSRSSDSVKGDIEQLELDALTPLPAPGADIKALDEEGNVKKGRATGKFVAGIGNVGLALCRLENMTPLRVSAEGGTFKKGMEFGVEADGELIKVVPVLHQWFVRRKEELWDRRSPARGVDED